MLRCAVPCSRISCRLARDKLVKVVLQWRRFSALVVVLFLAIASALGIALVQEIQLISLPEETIEEVAIGDPNEAPSIPGWINLGAVVGFVYAELWYTFRTPRRS